MCTYIIQPPRWIGPHLHPQEDSSLREVIQKVNWGIFTPLLLGCICEVQSMSLHFQTEVTPCLGKETNRWEKQSSHPVSLMVSGLELVYLSLFITTVRKRLPAPAREGPAHLCMVRNPGREWAGAKQWQMPVWIIAIIAFWKTTNLIPSKMPFKFARSSDGENKIPF